MLIVELFTRERVRPFRGKKDGGLENKSKVVPNKTVFIPILFLKTLLRGPGDLAPKTSTLQSLTWISIRVPKVLSMKMGSYIGVFKL